MSYLIIFRILITVLGLAFFLTQIIIPAISNRKMFPMFNRRKNSKYQKLVEINEELDLIELEDEAMRKLYRERNKNRQNN